jgi:hypothetical protein
MRTRLARLNLFSRLISRIRHDAALNQLQAELAAAGEREKTLQATVQTIQDLHGRASEQHAHAVEQHRHAAGQLHHAMEQNEKAQRQLWLAQDQLRHGVDELARLSGQVPDPALGPNLFLCTLPKSGTIYLANLFRRGLGHGHRSVSPGCFPRDLLDWQKVRAVSGGGAIVHTHLDASPANIQVLRVFQPKVQVHLRDPRQAALSMVYHVRNVWAKDCDPSALLHLDPVPPTEFYSRPMDAQIDWILEHYYPRSIRWIQDWLALADRSGSGVDVLVTTFEDLTRDEPQFVKGVLTFFGVDPQRFDWVAVERAIEMHTQQEGGDRRKVFGVHFRQGTPDEWRKIFSRDQQERALERLPVEWKDRFGWGA